MTGHAALARANFETGCNCAQAVLCAYPELLPRETAMKLGASLGGGIGRLREVCGAVSAMVLLAGLLYADTDIPTHERKQAHYARVQELAHRFQSAHGSYLCRDLLAGVETTPGGAPEAARRSITPNVPAPGCAKAPQPCSMPMCRKIRQRNSLKAMTLLQARSRVILLLICLRQWRCAHRQAASDRRRTGRPSSGPAHSCSSGTG